MLEVIEKRIKELEMAVEQSGANHNILFGQLLEARNVLQLMNGGAAAPVVDNQVANEAEVVVDAAASPLAN